MYEPFNQIELVAAVLKELDRQSPGVALCERKMNAVIRGIDEMLDDLNSEDRPVRDSMGIHNWLASDNTGLSSRFMAWTLSGIGPVRAMNYPHDPSDFNRCIGLLRAAPELREKLPLMKPTHPVWAALVDHWEELEALLAEEFPTGSAPKLYSRMRELIDGAAVSTNERNRQ